uniref:Periodic tryptophan protein 1 n=1 Tax=Knipowitschia caucasica TaxID=637954 RepID=A0AAV2L1W3_KNICA
MSNHSSAPCWMKASHEGLADTEEALKDFDFLVTEDGEGAGEARSSGDGTGWGETDLESVLGLGDLADLTVTNDEPDYGYDLQSSKESSFRKTELFRLTDPSLLSVSEDPTIKLWNLTKTVHTRK